MNLFSTEPKKINLQPDMMIFWTPYLNNALIISKNR
jgi:hypothetical protein